MRRLTFGICGPHRLKAALYGISHSELTEAQIANLNDLTRDLPETDKVLRCDTDGNVDINLPMNSDDVVLVKLVRSKKGK